jgi:predicted nucleic acid-binding protein
MGPPIFIDTNVPIYAAGSPHPLKDPCRRVLDLVARQPDAFFTDAEVLQELLHRYLALRRWPQGRVPFERFMALMDPHIEPIHAVDVKAAAGLVRPYSSLSGRDLIHLAVMQRVGAQRIVSADNAFDAIPSVIRWDPADVTVWQSQVGI